MQLHIEKCCAGLRAIYRYDGPEPDFLLYIGPSSTSVTIPETISGISVIETPAYFGGVDFGICGDLWYVPCYRNMQGGHQFRLYKNAYEDYDEAVKE